MKRLLIVLIALLLVCCAAPVSAFTYEQNWSTYMGDAYPGDAIPLYLPDTECIKAGFSGVEPGYANSSYIKYFDTFHWVGHADTIIDVPSINNFAILDNVNYDNLTIAWTCKNSGLLSRQYQWWDYHYNTTPPVATANFIGSLTNGVGPLNVTFTDTSTNATSWNWSITPETGVYMPTNRTTQHFSAIFTANGNYTVSHGVSNAYGSDIETKTNYIWVYNSSSTITTSFVTTDYYYGGTILNTTINLNDTQNSSWINATGTNGHASITTLAGHTINAYASGWGWFDSDLLAVPADGQEHPILMRATGFFGANASAGNVTLIVTVRDDDTSALLENVKLSVLLDGGGMLIGYTNAAGAQNFVVTNNTDIRIAATKAGFGDVTVFDNTGPGNGGNATKIVPVRMNRDYVTPTAVITTLPGGGLPTTIATVDPYPCIGDGSYQDTLNCQRKQGEMGADLIAYGPQLVQFFIMLTFVGGIGLMLKLGK